MCKVTEHICAQTMIAQIHICRFWRTLMTKYEFINGLKSALENDLSSNLVQEHVNYYNDYINSEIRNGRSESEVIAELGDPWALAKNIIATEDAGSSSYEEYSYDSSDKDISKGRSSEKTTNGPKAHIFGIDKWWKKLLLILGIIGVVIIVFSIITGLISLVAPLIMPIIFISLIIRLFRKMR